MINGFLNKGKKSCFIGFIVKETKVFNSDKIAITLKDLNNSKYFYVCLNTNLLKKIK